MHALLLLHNTFTSASRRHIHFRLFSHLRHCMLLLFAIHSHGDKLEEICADLLLHGMSIGVCHMEVE